MTERHPRRDVFRYTPGLRAVILAGLVICLVGALSMYSAPPTRRNTLTFYALSTLSILFVVAVAEALVVRIELRDEEIRVVKVIGHKSYARARVVEARWEKGCPVSLKLADGGWAALPDTGHANTKVAGAIRAWLNEG